MRHGASPHHPLFDSIARVHCTARVVLLLVLFALVFALALLGNATLNGGWTWDGANALGFAALAGLLYLSSTPRGARDLKRHERFSYVVAGLAAGHAGWFLVTDNAALEYIKPDAPLYMWAGVAGLLLIVLTVIVSVIPTRLRVFGTSARFKNGHRAIGVVAVVLSGYHIVGAGFYLRHDYQILGLVLLALWVSASRALRLTPSQASVASPSLLMIVTCLALAGFVLIKNLT